MHILTVSTGLLVVTSMLLHGQTADTAVTFDVASVKPLTQAEVDSFHIVPRGPAGLAKADMWAGEAGLGSKGPTRIHYPVISLKTLILNAYDVENFQLRGPDWLDAAWFAVDASMSPGTTRAQFRIMLQNLLLDRFKLVIHREEKDSPGYSLVVARSGPKMKESVEPREQSGASAPVRLTPPPRFGADSSAIVPLLGGVTFQGMGDRIRMTFRQTTMQALANSLQARLKRPVVDATGLTAKFDFSLTFSTEGLDLGTGPMPPLPQVSATEPAVDLFEAVRSQLGLRLEPKKGSMPVVVIDHVEMIPTAN